MSFESRLDSLLPTGKETAFFLGESSGVYIAKILKEYRGVLRRCGFTIVVNDDSGLTMTTIVYGNDGSSGNYFVKSAERNEVAMPKGHAEQELGAIIGFCEAVCAPQNQKPEKE